MRIWNRALDAKQASALYSSDIAPSDGLVAEFLLNVDTSALES